MNNVIRFGENFIEMEFKPDWKLVKNLWEFLKNVIQLILYDSYKSDLISMAGIELVENAVKYTMSGKVDNKKITFRLDSFPEKNKVIVKVTNRALIHDIRDIQVAVTNILSEKNKRKIYLQKLREYANTDEEKMELGIMRIIVEAGANILVEKRGGNILSIKAIFNVYRKL